MRKLQELSRDNNGWEKYFGDIGVVSVTSWINNDALMERYDGLRLPYLVLRRSYEYNVEAERKKAPLRSLVACTVVVGNPQSTPQFICNTRIRWKSYRRLG